jgi:hypothetical protein
MSYEREHVYLRMLGHFGTSGSALDNWSTGLRLAVIGGSPITTSDFTVFLESISSAIATFHSNTNVVAGSSCFLSELTAAPIGTDGFYPSKSTLTTRRPYAPVIAGAGAGAQPWSTAIVTSMRTAAARGYASNGRMYWPAAGAAPDPASGRMGAATMDQYAIRVKTMLDAINTAAEVVQAGLRVHVMSQGGERGGPQSQRVLSVRIDRRLDSIERRENKQVPTWHTATLAAT